MNKLKLIILILVFCLICNFAHAQYQSNLTLKNKITDTVKSTQTLTEKSPFLAGTLSFIVPGFAVGQLYNGQTNKFFTHSLISTGLVVSFFMFGGKPSDINFFGTTRSLNISNLGFVFAYIVNWTWSVVDAVITANNINKHVKLQKYRSDIMNRIKLGFDVNKNKQLNLKFSFEL